MNTLKNFFKYLGIVILVCIGLCAILFAAMMIFKFPLFGYKYISLDSKDTAKLRINKNYDKDMPDDPTLIKYINVNSDNVGVEIKPWIEGKEKGEALPGPYFLELNVLAKGFAHSENNDYKLYLNADVKKHDGSDFYDLNINIKSPNGFVKYTEAKLIIYTPFETSTSDSFKDPSGATISLNNTLRLLEVNINTTAGNVAIKNNVKGNPSQVYPAARIYVDNLKVSTQTGNQNYSRCGIGNYTTTSKNGEINFEYITNGAITGDINIKTDYSKIQFNNGINIGLKNDTTKLDAHSCKIEGNLSEIKLNTLYNTAFIYKGNADNVNIGSAINSTLEIYSCDAKINIGSIYSNSHLKLSYNGDESNNKGRRSIDIGYIECSDNINIDTWSGHIKINTAYIKRPKDSSTSTIKSNSGNIEINQLIGNFAINSQNNSNVTIGQLDFTNENSLNEYKNNTPSSKALEFDLSSKQALLNEINNYLKNSHNIELDYENSLKAERDKLNSTIKDLKETIENIKNQTINDKLSKYNLIKDIKSSIINIKAKSGKITAKNISGALIADIVENGTSSIHAQFLTINADSNIHSEKGNVYLYMPLDRNTITEKEPKPDDKTEVTSKDYTPYWIYAETSSITSKNSTIFTGTEVLNANEAKAAGSITGYPSSGKVIPFREGHKIKDDIKNEAVKDGIPADEVFVITIDNLQGQTTIDLYASFK